MFKILKDLNPWHVAVLLNTPVPELDEHSPVAWERQGDDVEDLERLAHRFLGEWSRR